MAPPSDPSHPSAPRSDDEAVAVPAAAAAASAQPRAPRRLPRIARYQLRKEAVGVVLRDAPWIFRDHLSSAAEVFEDGQWLRLVDGKNRVLGYGLYEARGAIAIRVLRRGELPPDPAWLSAQVKAALARRAPLREGDPAPTDAFRVLHGESDGLPAVVVDVFADTLVVQSYSAGANAIARLAARWIARELGATRILMKPAQRRQGSPSAPSEARWLLGGAGDRQPAAAVTFREGALELTCDPSEGQKSGAFLDLRGLRRAVAAMPLTAARVLNLFAYTGMLGRCAERAGAREIWQVDASAAALELAARHHVDDASRHRMIVADVFEWLPALASDPAAAQGFELVIVDPPSMTSRRAQVPGALAAYRKLYRAAAPHVAAGGTLVAACCTSRITREEFRKTVTAALGTDFEAIGELPPEVDHPVSFPDSDYLKILLFRRRSA
jgi:23S rRNA (cytosine1962-C5)-methyltransferase